ncbi:cation/multidrug efflux pump [Pseudomaricurvus sp. HS19]|uniref:cation/multidrug efflux pump n=1 Tax=Pseudomaricurvus sp. HS19 TaxID=2692626 RepID=UPI001369A33C|nr:cation/multidrug efflux pump [Pseudomaricurvus sp. HS19]MYM62340.1 cation/multidrug efflux pump [Pseudomaricurvus sp. HS19]
MVYDILSVVLAVLGVIVLLLALKAIFSRGWLLGWIKGMVNLVVLVLAVLLGLLALDLFSYKELLQETPVATISFERLEDQHYQATLVLADGQEQEFELRGDQWQLDARIFKWSPSLARLGFRPGYRLDRLSGRYYSLDKERHGERTVYDLNPSQAQVDTWRWVRSMDGSVGWLDALYGSATFVPMSDGALYEVNLSHSGLTTRALNERAREALQVWK